MRYRPEIDGLRAIAVVPVILFHANPGIMPGGFIGVDVFFVISGYLITRILLDDLAAGHFSIVDFYERRMRRIAPALLFVCLACLPFAAMWMLPEELKSFGKSLFHALLMVSNFELWGGTSYFAAKSELKPLLHTWSLSVEEQFYLVFPLLLWGMRRCERRTIFWVVAGLSAVSFVLMWPIGAADPVANFYLPFTRFWELSAGALLAIGGVRSFEVTPQGRSVLAMVGLAGIVLGCGLIDPEGRLYPGPLTLVPCICTVLILAYASPENLAGRLLALPLFVGIGLISYSLYLWHQPIFAFARIRFLEDLPAWSYVLLIALTFALAIFSYFYVERPFRRSKRIGPRQVFGYGGGGAAALIVLGIVVAEADGFPGRRPGVVDMLQWPMGISKVCNGSVLPETCATGMNPEVAVWGDSYAMHLVDGILASRDSGAGDIIQLNKHGCGPFLNFAPQSPDTPSEWPFECMNHNGDVRSYIAATPSLRYVVLASKYAGYLDNASLMTIDGQSIRSEYSHVLAEAEAIADWLRSIGIKPVFMAPPPRDGNDIGLCVARMNMLGLSDKVCDIPREKQLIHDAAVTRLVADLAMRFPVVSLDSLLCDDVRCRATDDGVGIYRDSGHFSKPASIHLGKKLGFYQAFVNAAEQGCGGGTEMPSGICQLKPVAPAQAVPTAATGPG